MTGFDDVKHSGYFDIYEQYKIHAQLSLEWKKFYYIRPGLQDCQHKA